MPDDEEAICRVLAGDREAFHPVVIRHQGAVCATIRALRPGCEDWEDIAQDVFLSAFQHLATYDAGKGSFRTWLLAIARNQCRNQIRRLVPTPSAELPERPDDRTPPELVSEAEWFARLDACLAALPEDQRLVFALIELQGMTYLEAAEIAEVNIGTVKSRLFRAKASLREVLEPALADEKHAAVLPSKQNE